MDKHFATLCFLFLFWSNLIFGITVYIFQRGFLLKREVLSDRTVCPSSDLKNNNDSCYPMQPRQYSKAIVLIIDAFRYDFALHDQNASESDLKAYQNALPIISELMQQGKGKLFQSFADPPTTTMQRYGINFQIILFNIEDQFSFSILLNCFEVTWTYFH